MYFKTHVNIVFEDTDWSYIMKKEATIEDLDSPMEACYAICHVIDSSYDLNFRRMRGIRNEFMNRFRNRLFNDDGVWDCSFVTEEGVQFDAYIEMCGMEA